MVRGTARGVIRGYGGGGAAVVRSSVCVMCCVGPVWSLVALTCMFIPVPKYLSR
jgi:hypothetical protein